ncbi:alpha/beta hydrolase [Cephaloticoccus primus]|uniref:Alpha/beta hydrolase n=1 Tax=Cephaloticoccus primus TaxID=1548207 RepID=A0A139SMY8_9BACT|nr:alpha/beta hydrolase [Cephaloticoccus primus]
MPAELRTLYPFSSHWFRTPGGAQMHYLDEYGQGGEGREGMPHTASAEAVLMLHGNPTWSFYYAQLVQALSPALRCIVPDHIGMGLSEKPENYSYRLQTRIDDVAALVAQLGLRRVHLVVHDWGGAIGFGLAARHPELIGRIVVLNTAAFPSPRIPARIALCKAPLFGPLIVRGLNGFAWPALSMSMARRRLSALEKRALLLPYDSWGSRVAVSGFVRDIPMRESHPSWPALKGAEQGIFRFKNHPALILWGGHDFCFNVAFYDEWKKRLPQAEAHFLADAGHYVLLDAAEEILPRITRFLCA